MRGGNMKLVFSTGKLIKKPLVIFAGLLICTGKNVKSLNLTFKYNRKFCEVAL